MFTITVEAGFSAVHQLRLSDGTVEPRHGHDWVVRAVFAAAELDAFGMVADFDEARAALRRIVGELHHGDLNRVAAFQGVNPTAEHVARFVLDRLLQEGLGTTVRVEVTEAPGCVASCEVKGPARN